MSDIMLHAILNMDLPPAGEIDFLIRTDHYREASKRIKQLNKALIALTKSDNNWPMNVSDEDEALISEMVMLAGAG